MKSALRAALVWNDEVMDDVVLERPRPITIGARCVRRIPWLYILLIVGMATLTVADAIYFQQDLEPVASAGLAISSTMTALTLIWRAIARYHNVGQPTFTVPDLGLPALFAIIRPGNRGYVLTLGERMRGTVCIGGDSKAVENLVPRGEDQSGGFGATPISGRDWGVIDLDETGTTKLFFQFVTVEETPGLLTGKEILAGVAGNLLVAGFLWRLMWADAYYFEGIARAMLASLAILVVTAFGWALIRKDPDAQASTAFSIVLHLALLIASYHFYDGTNPFVWPGSRSLTGNYLVTKLDKEPEEKKTPTITSKGDQQQQMAAPPTKEPPKKTATKGDEGRQGGKGDVERARDPNAKDVPPEPPKVQFFEDKNKKILDNIIDRNLTTSLSKFTGLKGDTLKAGAMGFGPGQGTGVGPGEGTGTRGGSKKNGNGGGGNVEGDFVTGPGKIDTGTMRPGGGNCKGGACGTGPKEIKVGFAEPSGDFGGLTAEEIDRVVKARAGIFRACYQKELNHTPGLGGKLLIHFKIGGDGIVVAGSTATSGGTTLHNDAVESCVKSNINRLKFPAKGGIANVNYPFVFTQGG